VIIKKFQNLKALFTRCCDRPRRPLAGQLSPGNQRRKFHVVHARPVPGKNNQYTIEVKNGLHNELYG
jgi:hypothetical protein